MIKEMSTKDLFAMQYFEGELIRLDIIVRYLAIENYYGKNNFGFKLYAAMQDLRIGKGYSEKAVPQFIELIKSYEQKGYDKNSCVKVFKNLALLDGSHRMALHLYYNLPTICVDISPEVRMIPFGLDWLVFCGFTKEVIKIILDKARELHEKSRINFTGFLWGAAIPFKAEIFNDISAFGKVDNVKQKTFRSRELYNHMIKRIYAVDDIAQEKIDLKTQYLKIYQTEIISFNFQTSPHYRLKDATNLPLSKTVERVKKVVRDRYKNFLPQYFHDIIFHLSDNQYQSDYCDLVISPQINLKEMFDAVKKFSYALASDKAPYMPQNFPDEIPVGKDLDILVSPEDFDAVTATLKSFAEGYKSLYDVKIINLPKNTRIRFERSRQLILQLDLSQKLDSLNFSFIEDGIKFREFRAGYFALSRPYEYLYKLYKYAVNPKKIWHLDFLQKNIADYDDDLAIKYNAPRLTQKFDNQDSRDGGGQTT